MTKYIPFLLILMLFAYGCSPKAQLRRAERLIKKAELGGADWKHDTTFVKVPVFITETSVDTLFITKPGDTVVLNRDRLHVKYINLPGDSVFIEGKCDSVVVYKEVPVIVTNVVSAPQSNKLWWLLAIALAVVTILGLVLRK